MERSRKQMQIKWGEAGEYRSSVIGMQRDRNDKEYSKDILIRKGNGKKLEEKAKKRKKRKGRGE